MTRSRRAAERAIYAGRAAGAIGAQPWEGVERTIERVAEWRDVRRGRWGYEATDAIDRRLHELLGDPKACEADHFEEVWQAALGDLRARGLETGRGAFAGWDDGDARLGWLAWYLTRQLRPEFVVETGVGRGLTTRVILEAMERNNRGRLWSIDLPPLTKHELSEQTAAAVPAGLRERWTLLVGSSRRMLVGLLRGLPRVDLFLHDSVHTTRNVSFEVDRVWPVLRPGGAMLLDDVEKNRATVDFVRKHPDAHSVICWAEDGQVLLGVVIKPGG